MHVISTRPGDLNELPGMLVTVATAYGNADIWVNTQNAGDAVADVQERAYGVWPCATSWHRASRVHERTLLVSPAMA